MGYRMNLSKLACAWLLVGLLGAGTMACGDDDDDGNEAGTGGSAGTKAGSGGGGAGGSAGSKAGSGGASGAGSGAGSGGMTATKMCGTATCMGLTALGNMLPPCCDADNGNACGVEVDEAGTCIALMQEGDADTSCPSADSIAGTVVPGCCKADNKCGLMSGTLMGCIERTKYPVGFLMMVNMMPPPPLTAVDCGGDMDAGTQ